MSLKNKWLIKSDYKILGPYSYEQVEDLIMKKQISLIDEIRDMNLRWSYVREVPDFKILVETVRNEIDLKSDLTQTVQTAASGQRPPSASEISNSGITQPQSSHFSQVDLNEVKFLDPAKESFKKSDTFQAQSSKSEKSSPHSSALTSSNNLLKKVFATIFILIFVLGGAWYAQNIMSQNKNEKNIFQQIRKYNLYAQDDKAIELFKKLPPAAQDKIVVDIIPLWLRLEAAGALSSDQMLDLMSKGKIVGNERKSQYQLVKFNRAFNLGDIQNARDSLVKAIDYDPASVDVKENDAILNLSQKKYVESSKLFKNLYETTNQGRYLFGYVLSQIQGKLLNGRAAFQMISKHTGSRLDFNKELLFLQVYLLKKGLAENNESYHQYLESFLDFPFKMSEKFKMSGLINRSAYGWDQLESLRQELTTVMDPKESTLMNIHFYVEKGDITQAQDLFEKNQKILDENERFNLDIIFSFLKKNYQNVLSHSQDGKKLSLASQIIMLMIHKENKSNHSAVIQYVNNMTNEKQLFSNWALLMNAKMPEDKEQMKMLINSDRIYANEFLPYLEFRAVLNNE